MCHRPVGDQTGHDTPPTLWREEPPSHSESTIRSRCAFPPETSDKGRRAAGPRPNASYRAVRLDKVRQETDIFDFVAQEGCIQRPTVTKSLSTLIVLFRNSRREEWLLAAEPPHTEIMGILA